MNGSPRQKPRALAYASVTTPRRGILWRRWIVGAAVAIVLAAFMLLPSLTLPRDVGYDFLECQSHMHQIGLAMIMYANGDSLARFPNDLPALLTTQELDPYVFVCPSTNDTRAPGATLTEQARHLYDGGRESYIYLGAGLTSNAPSDVIVLFEPLTDHHGKGSNVLFADGHVEFLKKPAIEQVVLMYQRNIRPIDWPPHPATQL
jgi:prepilin-type processing-associated H-X9-DG protein